MQKVKYYQIKIYFLFANIIQGGDIMEITDVRVFLSSRNGQTKAYANLTFDDVFVIRSIKVIEGRNGLFVSMPARKLRDGDFQDVCFPITAEFRKDIQNRVISSYEKEIA